MTKLFLKTKADEQLFFEWKLAGLTIDRHSAIVQNDMEIGLIEILEWEKSVNDSIQKLEELKKKTKSYLVKSQVIKIE